MNCRLSRLLPALLLTSVSAFAQDAAVPQASPHVLRNNDVLSMVQAGVKSDEIISRINTSSCEFDIFLPVIQDLRQRGVPDAVLAKMKSVPYGPPTLAFPDPDEIAPRRVVKIPIGTVINIEVPKAISSADVIKGSPITFVVSRRVLVDGAVAIDRGAKVNGRVVKHSRPGLFGRGGLIEFALEDVVAVDGKRVPIQLSRKVKGGNHLAAITAGGVATGAIVFPYTAPVGLIWGLKKGDEAVIEGGTRLTAVVKRNQEVAGVPTERRPIYHPVTGLRQKNASSTPGLGDSGNQSFRPTSIKH
jgi:hypothetical protein